MTFLTIFIFVLALFAVNYAADKLEVNPNIKFVVLVVFITILLIYATH